MNRISVPRNAALLVVDVQQGLDDWPYYGGERNNPDAEAKIATLMSAWRSTGRPVVHVQHDSVNPRSPLRPGQAGNAVKPEAAPLDGEPVLRKKVNSAFIGTDLDARLRAEGIDTVVVVGLTTDHCVSTTVRMAANLGFRAVVVSDATATFARTGPDGARWGAEVMHGVALASLNDEFAAVVDTATLLRALRR
jgi:nicotinamidase-related amidase